MSYEFFKKDEIVFDIGLNYKFYLLKNFKIFILEILKTI